MRKCRRLVVLSIASTPITTEYVPSEANKHNEKNDISYQVITTGN